jgi:hypothetical protein
MAAVSLWQEKPMESYFRYWGKARKEGDICAQLCQAIVTLRPDWHDDDLEKGSIKVVMTGSAANKELLQPPPAQQAGEEAAGKAFLRMPKTH